MQTLWKCLIPGSLLLPHPKDHRKCMDVCMDTGQTGESISSNSGPGSQNLRQQGASLAQAKLPREGARPRHGEAPQPPSGELQVLKYQPPRERGGAGSTQIWGAFP